MTQETSFTSGSSFGQYRIGKLLGRGGMGSVYEVEHMVLGKRYAIKVLNEELMRDKGLLDRLKREAYVLANLDHLNIVKVDDFGETDAKLWLRMELVEGREDHSTLQDWIDAVKGPFREEVATEIIRQILNGLKYAHANGAIHRDLKPSNILLTENGIKVADFGLVKLAGVEWYKTQIQESIVKTMVRIDDERTVVEGNGNSMGSSSRAMMGTFEYMAPEVKEGGEATEQSDLYAVGLMAFRMLTGERLPGFDKPTDLNSSLSPVWNDWLKRILHPKIDLRFRSASAASIVFGDSDAYEEKEEYGLEANRNASDVSKSGHKESSANQVKDEPTPISFRQWKKFFLSEDPAHKGYNERQLRSMYSESTAEKYSIDDYERWKEDYLNQDPANAYYGEKDLRRTFESRNA